MAQYYFDPNDFEVGDSWNELPFTARWGSEIDLEIIDLGGGQKALSGVTTSSSNRLASFDPVDSDPNTDEVEVFAVFRHTTPAGFSNRFYVAGRCKSAPNFPGYWVGAQSETTYRILLVEGSASSGLATLADWSGVSNHDDFASVHGKISGNQVSARVWRYGTDRPSGWSPVVTDDDVTGTGHVGIAWRVCSFECLFFGVGTNGDPAPTEPLEEPVVIEGPPYAGGITAAGTVQDGTKVAAGNYAGAATAASETTGLKAAAGAHSSAVSVSTTVDGSKSAVDDYSAVVGVSADAEGIKTAVVGLARQVHVSAVITASPVVEADYHRTVTIGSSVAGLKAARDVVERGVVASSQASVEKVARGVFSSSVTTAASVAGHKTASTDYAAASVAGSEVAGHKVAASVCEAAVSVTGSVEGLKIARSDTLAAGVVVSSHVAPPGEGVAIAHIVLEFSAPSVSFTLARPRIEMEIQPWSS